MKKVFLSYARKDLKIAKKIYDDLTDKGVKVWLDKNELLPGQNWVYAIRQAIDDSSHFIALLSTNSVSKRGYVQKELKMAVDILDEYPQDQIFIIPVRIDDCKPTHDKLRYLQWADLFTDYEKEIQNILRVLAPPESKAQQSKSDTDIPSEEEEKTQKPTEIEEPQSRSETVLPSEERNKSQATPESEVQKTGLDSAIPVEEEKKPQKTVENKKSKPLIPNSNKVVQSQHRANWLRVLIVLAACAVIVAFILLILRYELEPVVRLRSSAATLSSDDVKAMLKKHNFFDRNLNKSRDFKNDFQDNNNGTVTDRKTGLMWQQSGSDNEMKYEATDDYIRKLNRQGLAGHKDWRLPTLEELASLLERQEINSLYIDPVFDKKQWWCWSADKYKGSSGSAWRVGFSLGGILSSYFGSVSYVRLVRAGQ
ncbi:TIR domain-containing protein [Desulfococcaceae bacterium HSG7]|nr:TIR domain-containing protein [Desulfococcaceae bacterium HSG7]